MPSPGNIFNNNHLAQLTGKAPKNIVNAIKMASAKTGVDFAYLMEKAATESNFKPDIKAKNSTATGLFQFIESTWMNMVKQYGHKYGISTNQSREKLLEMRKDPKIASFMAAEFASDNKKYLQKHTHGKIGATEMYLAHFMGAKGASDFLNAMEKKPNATAANIFPREAKANKGVFYDPRTGKPRTLQQIYDFFDKKFTDTGDYRNKAGGNTAPNVQNALPVNMYTGRTYLPAYLIHKNATSRNTRNDGISPFTKPLLSMFSNQIAETGKTPPHSLTPKSLYQNISINSTDFIWLALMKRS